MHCWEIERAAFSRNTRWVFGFLLALLWAQPGLAREVQDRTGVKVQLSEKPMRVITLIPSLGELAADLLGEDQARLIAVSEYTDYPPVLKTLPTIGNYARFNLETVVSMKPDLVLASTDGNSRDQIQHLRELKIPVVVVGSESFKEIEDSILLTARSLGVESRGQGLVKQLKTGLENIRQRSLKRKQAKRVLLQLDDAPLVVVGHRTFLHEALAWVGGTNVYSDSLPNYPRPALDDVVKRNPDAIVVLALGGGRQRERFGRMAVAWKAFPSVSAVKSKQIFVLEADALMRPSLRLLEGLSVLERTLYPESR